MKRIALLGMLTATVAGTALRQCDSDGGYATREFPMAHYRHGADNLTLTLVYTTGWNQSFMSVQLLFNNRLVDFVGQIQGVSASVASGLPIHREDRQRMNVASLFEPKAGEKTWVVWVNPRQFSAAEYERIRTLLTQGGNDLRKQQDAFYRTTDLKPYLIASVRYAAMNPAKMIYFDNTAVKDRLFSRVRGGQQDEITVTFGGQVNIARIKGDPADYGHTLGELDDTGDTLQVDMEQWKASRIHFPLAQLTEFRDAHRCSLTSRYQVVAH